MSTSRTWSNASAPCRLEWRSSRAFAAACFALGILAAVAAIASELPWPVSFPLAIASVAHGTWLAMRELLQPAANLVIPPGEADATLDGEAMIDLRVQWRGPLTILRWRSAAGGHHRLQGWPDNLDAAARRELRLAMADRVPARSPRSVAP
jgi:toxin CptA